MPLLELSVPIDMPVTSDETGGPVIDNGVVDPFANDNVCDMHMTHDEIDDFDQSADPADPVIDSTTQSADLFSDGDMNFIRMELDITDVIDVVEPIKEDSFNVALSETVLEDQGVTYTIIELAASKNIPYSFQT
ncbi:uncharacterized protein LOC127841726 [Dreissena polymorpha]|uniref:Uncharacterized protein n=1 Tax=Dreissena polymorpha TaxID=45954 RepID=A0A9D4RYV1_DREPO|nr:uncharacterized protein LOC127841726 [Dreissena polymorpha]XP_052226738.1 uncharacterized protein LOC127841726 [Dreissena polymorpha]KAH3886096.1 hypothetical protein DPMN_010097 [Dreissena polymorpha]